MVRQRKRRPERGRSEADAGLSFGGMFEGLGKLIEAVTEAAEKGEAISREGGFRVPGKKDARGVYGFTVRSLAGSKPVIRPFGNLKETPKGPVVDEVREPMVDVFEEDKLLRVIAEMPGCEKKDIRTEIKGDILTLAADARSGKYRGEVLLPCPVESKSLRSSYRNGMLEIELRRKK